MTDPLYHKTYVGGDENNDNATCCGCGGLIKGLNRAARIGKNIRLGCGNCGRSNIITFRWSLAIVAFPEEKTLMPDELNW